MAVVVTGHALPPASRARYGVAVLDRYSEGSWSTHQKDRWTLVTTQISTTTTAVAPSAYQALGRKSPLIIDHSCAAIKATATSRQLTLLVLPKVYRSPE
jgi:hypothetical protein